MISCIVTAYQEPRTVGTAIKALLDQPWQEEFEVLVICPDPPTAAVAKVFADCYPQVVHLADKGEGKPAALNLALSRARGDICIFTDGDVRVLNHAIPLLLAPFTNPACGAVSGRPVSANPRDTMLGYWSHLLTDAGAHAIRSMYTEQQRYIDCSGYLYAVRRSLLTSLPLDVLADDAYISQFVWRQGYRIAYVADAQVAVRYPKTYRDWLLQKVRSSAGASHPPVAQHIQQQKFIRPAQPMRSLGREALAGFYSALVYGQSFKEHCWTLCLFAARIHLWSKVWWETHIKKRSHRDIWQRVESTK